MPRMKLLLDENLPNKLKFRFPDYYDVRTVPEMNWGGIKNGDLLKNMHILITIDKIFSHQQNLVKYQIILTVFDAIDNRYETLVNFIPELILLLTTNLTSGVFVLQKQ